MSKGSKRRPQQIPSDEMQRRWEMAFGNKRKPTQENDQRKKRVTH